MLDVDNRCDCGHEIINGTTVFRTMLLANNTRTAIDMTRALAAGGRVAVSIMTKTTKTTATTTV